MTATRSTNKAFTLIELLIVVAIIAILALIAVPNFLEAQTRAKVSRAHADMRSLATALESYRVDYNGVPMWDSWEPYSGDDPARLSLNLVGYFWIAMTTPVSYITSAFRDPFVVIGQKSTPSLAPGTDTDDDKLDPWIQVGTGDVGSYDERTAAQYWCAASYGPDHSDNTINMGHYPYVDIACPYDPTNGTVSRGDIYRHSHKPPTNFVVDINQPQDQGQTNPWW